MWRKLTAIVSALIIAFGILLTSVFRTAAVKYEFSSASGTLSADTNDGTIDYQLAFPGRVLPDSTLWPIKVLRDRIWLWMTTNPARRAEIELLFADKRVVSSKILFEGGKADTGLSTLTKAEKYLERAVNQERENRKKGIDTSEFLQRAALASLKHYELIEEIYDLAPDEAKPLVVQSQTYAKRAYEETRNALLEKGLVPPENPFEW